MRELRLAMRQLRRAPFFTATMMCVLALASGAGVSIFSLLRGLVLRPLPVPHPEQLVQVTTRDPLGRDGDLTWRQFHELRGRQRAFSALIGSIEQGAVTATPPGGILQASIACVTGNFFGELGARPSAGRLLSEADEDLGAATAQPVVVLGWSFWQGHYGGNPAVVGTAIRVEGLALTIVGVAPAGFHGLGVAIEHDLTIPLTLFPHMLDAERSLIGGTARWVSTTGRLASGVSIEESGAELRTLWPAIRDAARPPDLAGTELDAYRAVEIDVTSGARGVERGLRGRYADPLYTLLIIAGIILLFAAVNLGSLVFVRAEAARHELGVKLALGAGRARLVRELTIQGALLGIAGTVGALTFAGWTSHAVAAFLLRDYRVPTDLRVAPDSVVVFAAAIASVGIGALICALAAWAVTTPSPVALRAGCSRSVAGASRAGNLLIGVQAALAVVLLTSASLLARNLYALTAVDAGLSIESVRVASTTPRAGAYRNLDPAAYYRSVLTAVRSIPGVEAAAFSQERPERGAVPTEPVGRMSSPAGREDVAAESTRISPGFFETLGIPLLAGRDFAFADDGHADRVVIVSRRLADRLFGAGRGLGERIRLSTAADLQNLRVIGIVGDAQLFDVRRGNVAIAYLPALQRGRLANYKFLVVKAQPGAGPEIRRVVAGFGAETLDGLQAVSYIRGRTLMQERVMAAVGGYFGVLALLLVAAGVHGLISYVLSLRRKEIGIRMALGADPARIGRGVVSDSLRVAGLGLAAGLIAAVPATRVLRSVLVAVDPFDPLAAGLASGLLLVVVTIASLAPAIRAARVEPLAELRRE